MQLHLNEKRVLLTIAIPTFNRASYLELCLKQILKQIPMYEQKIEVLVSNNASTDNTESVVSSFRRCDFDIRYIRNERNIGAEANVIQCFDLARGDYVWVFGDDDILLDGALDKIFKVLENGQYGLIYLKSYSFDLDFVNQRPPLQEVSIDVYNNRDYFIKRVNYLLTFISSNICNKKLIRDEVNIHACVGTNLPQLSWVFLALIKATNHVVINEYLVAAKSNNSGGYELCRVFGANFNDIMLKFLECGFSEKWISIINNNLLCTFFPFHIVNRRAMNNSEDFSIMYPIFKYYYLFWFFVVPTIELPLLLARSYILAMQAVHKTAKTIIPRFDVKKYIS